MSGAVRRRLGVPKCYTDVPLPIGVYVVFASLIFPALGSVYFNYSMISSDIKPCSLSIKNYLFHFLKISFFKILTFFFIFSLLKSFLIT